MNTNLRFASFVAGLAVGLSCMFALPGWSVAQGLLPLRVAAEDLDAAGTDALTAAITGKIGRYPDIRMMPVPPDDPIDVMLDAGCEDLNKECLMLIGKVKGADFVLYTTAATVDGRFRIAYRYVDVATGRLRTVDRGAGPGDDPTVFAALVLEEILGAEPGAVVPAPAPAPAPVVVPVPEPVPVPVPVPEPVPAPVVAPVPEPVPEPAPVPVAAPAPEPAPVAVVAPVTEPVPVPVAAPVSEPAPAVVPSPVYASSPVDAIPVEPVAEVKKAPFYKTWWFWTIIGVAVVGAGTAAGVIAAQDGDAAGQVGFSADPGYAPLDVTLFR